MRRLLLFTLFVLLPASPALAGPPLLTNDTGTPGDRHWEINIAYTLEMRHSTAIHNTPIFDLNYGIGDNVQVTYDVSWLVFHDDGAGTKSGLGNSVAGVKWRFLDDKPSDVAVSVYPQFEFNNPTSSADRGLVDEGTKLFLPVQVTKKIGRGWVNGEAGYTFRRHSEDQWLYGLSGGYEFRENITLVGELHGGTTKAFRKHEVVVNIGTQWDLNKRYGILASVGRGLKGDDGGAPNLLAYLGVQIRL